LGDIGKLIELESERESVGSRIIIFQELVRNWRSLLKRDGVLMITTPSERFSSGGARSWIDYYLDDLPFVNRGRRVRGGAENTIPIESHHPDIVWKMNRMGQGLAGNVWREANIEIDPDIAYYRSIPSAGTVYFMFWGAIWNHW